MRGSWSGLMGSWTKAQIEGLIPWGGFLYFGKSGKCRNFSTLHLSVKWMAKQHRTQNDFSMGDALIHWYKLIAKELAR